MIFKRALIPWRRILRDERAGNSKYLVAVALAAVAVLLPIAIFGVPQGADLPNHLRFALPFYDAIQSGHFHPGWLAESNYGMGDPRFRFYPPGFYYLLSTTRMLTGGWYWGTVTALGALSIAGALGVYFWARTVCESRIAMWAGILYAVAPYRLNEIYQASLLSEYAACSVLPFAFVFVERICRRRKSSDIAGLAGAYALLVLTHLPLAVIGSIALGIYALLRIERKNLLATLARLSAGVVLGLAASSFYWVTMLAELSWIKGSRAAPNIYYDYRLNFLFSRSALTNRNTWYANLLALALIGFLLPSIVLIGRWLRKETPDRQVKAALLLAMLSLLMATELSRPVWAVVPKLAEVQFPWRWLAITSLMASLLVAASLPKWLAKFRTNLRPRDLAVAAAFAISLLFTVSQVVYDSDYEARARFDSMTREIRGAVSFKDWLPVAARAVAQLEPMKSKVEAGERSITIESWQPERRAFQVAAGDATEARLRTYYYPLWVASADGERISTRAAADGGLMISLPGKATTVVVEFQEPARTHTATMLSLLGWIAILLLLIARPAILLINRHWFASKRKAFLLAS